MSKNKNVALVDLELAKKMSENLTHNAKLALQGRDKVVKYLRSLTNKSKTAFYYLGILEDRFVEDNFNPKSLEYFRLGEGDLFCDYMLFKNEYMKSSLSVSIGNMMINMSPLQQKLQYLAKNGVDEAQYLLTDCIALPIMGMKNDQASMKEKAKLAQGGHRAAEYEVANYLVTYEGVNKKNIDTIHGYLIDSSNKDYIPATKLLLQLYLDKVLPCRSKKEIAILEERLAYRDKEHALDTAKRYLFGYRNTKVNYTKALEYLNIAAKLGCDCTKLYALVYYFSYLGLKEHNRSYVVTLETAVKYLKECAPTGDLEVLTYLGDVYYTEKDYKNLDYALKYYDFVFKSKPSKELALKLFYIYYLDKDMLNRDPKLYEYSYYLYRIGYYEDENVFKTFYKFAKPVNDIETLVHILERVKDIYHDFYLKERSIIYFRVQDPQNGIELFNMIDEKTLTEEDYEEFSVYMDLTAKTKAHMEAAVKVYDKLAREYKNADAAFRIGAYYYAGRMIEKNKDLAKEYLIIASVNGRHDADYYIAKICFLNRDYRRGIEWLNTGAAYNDTEAECAFADVHFKGEYVAQDLEIAADYYHRAAEKKHPRATFQLGFMLLNGIGFKKDEERGMHFIEEASSLGYNASFDMSTKYFNSGDNEKGLELLNKALNEENDLRAADKLGDIYFNGEIVKRDYKKAYDYYIVGDSLNIANSTYHLGLYFDGTVKKNKPKKALKYFEKAALLGSKDAKTKVALLAFDLGKYDTAYTYLTQSLDDSNPRTYYCLAYIHQKRKVKGVKKEDAKFYAKKAYELGYKKARRFM